MHDSAKALATLRPAPLEDRPVAWPVDPSDLDEPPRPRGVRFHGDDNEGHPHDHYRHKKNNLGDEKTGSDEAAPSKAPNATDGPDMARRASNRRRLSEGDAARRRSAKRRKPSAFALSQAIASNPVSVVDHEASQLPWAELIYESLLSYQDVCIAAGVVSLPCIPFVFVLARSGPYLEGGGDPASEEGSLYGLGNYTATNTTTTTLCPA